MQQTGKYQFNLIETSDAFSPDPLNENMEKVEAQFDAVRAEAAAGDEALDARVALLEARHCIVGQYQGDNTPYKDIFLDFDPKAVLVPSGTAVYAAFKKSQSNSACVVLSDGGFRVKNGSSANFNTGLRDFIAIG